MFVLAAGLVRGPVGRALVAIRDDEIAAHDFGVDLAAYKTRAFAISAAYAGVGGSMFVFSVGFVAPESFSLALSFPFLAAVVVGGLATIAGAMFGALFIEFVPVYAADVDEALAGVIYGAVLIPFMYVLPRAWSACCAVSARGTGRATKEESMRWSSIVALLVLALLAPAAAAAMRTGEAAVAASGAAAAPGSPTRRSSSAARYPFSGPASAYATIARGAQARFEAENAKGGVDGRKIQFITLDDGYEPQRAVTNARRLVEQDKVFALFNTLGTPNNLAIWDYAQPAEGPARSTSPPARRSGARTSRSTRTRSAGSPTTSPRPRPTPTTSRRTSRTRRSPSCTRTTASARTCSAASRRRIEGTDIKIVARESYEVTDPTVTSQMRKLAASGADTFLNITTPKFSAQAIAAVAKSDWKPLHILNNVGASKKLVLEPVGLENAQGIVSTAYFKDPEDPQWADDAAMQEYKDGAQASSSPRPTADDVLRLRLDRGVDDGRGAAGDEGADREALMEAVRNMDAEIPLLLPGDPGEDAARRRLPDPGRADHAVQRRELGAAG